MTTVACNLEGMACDSFTGDGLGMSKVLRGRDMLIGFCGEAYWGVLLAEWVIGGERGPAPPWDENYHEKDEKAYESCSLLILTPRGIWTMDGRGKRLPTKRQYAAIGSGSDAALGALFWGRTPEEAVMAGIEFDSESKGPIEWHVLHQSSSRRRPR